MSSAWDDFNELSKDCKRKPSNIEASTSSTKASSTTDKQDHDTGGCEWGFSRRDGLVGADGNEDQASNSSRFITVYERYLENKQAFSNNEPPTKNNHLYANNPQRAIREWFDNEGHDFVVETDKPRENEYVCSLDLPLDEHDFTLTSDVHSKKQLAIDEICLVACKLLDQCQLLYSWQFDEKEDNDRKRQFAEANKEDDIELDRTVKRHCNLGLKSKSIAKVNTYESLMDKWMELNKCIIQLKAELVKLDLSVTKIGDNRKFHKINSGGVTTTTTKGDVSNNQDDNDDDEIDPLDEFMSTLATKTELTTNEKIEKSRLRSEIHTLEQEQSKVSRLIELAKPRFDLGKACSRKEMLVGPTREEQKKG